jgi:hypothetical protein
MPAHLARVAAAASLCAIFCAALSAQTAIAVFRNSTEIVAGSDSRGNKQGGGSVVLCKVHRLRNLYWSEAGLSADVSKVVAKASAGGATIRQTAERFSKLMVPEIESGMQELRTTEPATFDHFMNVDGGVWSYIFYGMEKGTPVVAQVNFHAAADDHLVKAAALYKVLDEPTCSKPEIPCGFTAGYDREMKMYAALGRKTDDLVGTVRTIVQLEIDAVPDKVGPPLRILKIDSRGPQWIQNSEGCSADLVTHR